MIAVTRRYRFPAAHVLASPALSDAENERIFGKCARPNGHGHDYAVEVTVTGECDPDTGWIVAPEVLDAAFDTAVRRPFSHRLLNDLDCFAGCVPTAENLARAVHEGLSEALRERTSARLLRVVVVETPRNRFEYGDEAGVLR